MMQMYSSDYRDIAREALRGKWKKMILLMFVSAIISSGLYLSGLVSNFFSDQIYHYVGDFRYRYLVINKPFGFGWVLMAIYVLIQLLIEPMVTAGQYALAQDALSGGELELRRLFPKALMWKLVGMSLLRSLLVGLWSLLLVIPGIIAGYRYSMADYLLINHPEMGAVEALRRSKELMRGNKMAAFSLDWSFLGWVLLEAVVSGIVMALGIMLEIDVIPIGLLALDLLATAIASPVSAYMNTARTAFFISIERAEAQVKAEGTTAAAETETEPDPAEAARRAAEKQAKQHEAAEASACEMYLRCHCSHRLLEQAGLAAEYEALLGGRRYQEELWRRGYVDELMRRFDTDPAALDDIIALAGEYGMDDLADRALGRIDRHIWQNTLSDAETLNLLGRMLSLLQAESFAAQMGFVSRKKRQILDMAERLERRLNETDPDGAWRDAMQTVREMAAE